MKSIRAGIVSAVLMAVLSVSGVVAQGQKPVAVAIPYSSLETPQADVESAFNKFMAELARTERYSIVEQGKVKKIMAQPKFRDMEPMDIELYMQLGKAVGADIIIAVDVMDMVWMTNMLVQIFDVKSGELVSGVQETGGGVEKLLPKFPAMCEQLTHYMGPSKKQLQAKPASSVAVAPTYLKIAGTKIVGCDIDRVPARLVIPDGITEISENVFNECDTIVSLTIPSSVKKIGENAFMACSSLKEIVFSEGLGGNRQDGVFRLPFAKGTFNSRWRNGTW